jgi:nucleoside-diphosphate-sugar epimerase
MYYRSSVKRIVVTSSCDSILENRSEPTEFSELDWNRQSIQVVEENGRNALQGAKYRASKMLAEKGT